MWWDILSWWWAERLLWKLVLKGFHVWPWIHCHVIGRCPGAKFSSRRSQEAGKVHSFILSFPSSGSTGRGAAADSALQRALAASEAILRLSHIQKVIFSLSCPVTSTNTPSLPLLFSPSWLSNKAMGHISEAFRGSLAHPLVSANHCCNREPNLYRSFNQTQTAGSSRSRGRMIQLPQRHQAKTDIKLKIKTRVMAQWHGKSIYEFQSENWSAIFLFRGHNLVLPPLVFSYYLKPRFYSCWQSVTETSDRVRRDLTGSRHLGLTADREAGHPAGNGLTGG